METALREVRVELGRKVDAEALDGILGTREDLARQVEMLDEKATSITTSLGDLTAETISRFQEIDDALETRASIREVEKVAEDLGRLRERIDELMEESGFGVVMDIGKIPPHILESVYQSTIDDVLKELRKTIGPHDTELLIEEAKEEVRLKTSGSELFHFDPPNLVVKGVATAVGKGLISGRQVHTTYQELLRKLHEPIPHYKPVNFRAMLKVKSQEYAVDRSTILAESLGDLQAAVRESEDRMEAARAETEERIGVLSAELAAVAEAMEPLRGLPERLEALEARLESMEQQGPPKRDQAEAVLAVITDKGRTANRIHKELMGELSEERVAEVLKDLVERGLVDTVARGRWTVYVPAKEAPAAPEEPPSAVSVEQLEGDSRAVYDAVGPDGRTLNGLRGALRDEVRYTDLLKALRVLLDGGVLSTVERGRHTVYVRTKRTEVERNA